MLKHKMPPTFIKGEEGHDLYWDRYGFLCSFTFYSASKAFRLRLICDLKAQCVPAAC